MLPDVPDCPWRGELPSPLHPHTRHVPRARLADGTPAASLTSFFGLGFLFLSGLLPPLESVAFSWQGSDFGYPIDWAWTIEWRALKKTTQLRRRIPLYRPIQLCLVSMYGLVSARLEEPSNVVPPRARGNYGKYGNASLCIAFHL